MPDSRAEGGLKHQPNPVRAFLRLVVFQHSVFALPFAFISMLTAMYLLTGRVDWWTLVLITAAMVFARTFAMAANRLIDREIDARNPRTASRELVTGVVSLRTARIGAVVALIAFLACAAALNWLCLVLAPLAVIPLIGYSYVKRVMWAPHAVLGIAQAVAPVGAWLGVTGHFVQSGVNGSVSVGPAVVLGVAVGAWIGGFDLIYTCQDVESDRAHGVGSVPARWGVRVALISARITHVVVFALLVWFGLMVGSSRVVVDRARSGCRGVHL